MRLATPEKEDEASDEIEFDQMEQLEVHQIDLGQMDPITEEDDQNSDLRHNVPENLVYQGEYNTMQHGNPTALDLRNEQDGLPTILEQSC